MSIIATIHIQCETCPRRLLTNRQYAVGGTVGCGAEVMIDRGLAAAAEKGWRISTRGNPLRGHQCPKCRAAARAARQRIRGRLNGRNRGGANRRSVGGRSR